MSTGVHVALDAVGTRRGSGGVVVLNELVNALSRDPRMKRITVFSVPDSQRGFDLPRHPKVTVASEVRADSSRASRVGWILGGLARRCRTLGVDVVVCLSGAGRISTLPAILFIQQALWFSPTGLQTHRRTTQIRLKTMRQLSQLSCKQALYVVTQTSCMATDVIRHFRIDPTKVRVITPDVSWPDEALNGPVRHLEAAPADRRVLYLGSSEPHKSLQTVVQAFRRVRRQLPDARLFLATPRLVAEHGIWLGRVPRAAVPALLDGCTVLISGSLAESVGLSLLEALDRGRPVVAPDLPYVREVCGDGALRFRSQDPADCAHQLVRLLRDERLRRSVELAGRVRTDHLRRQRPGQSFVDLIASAASQGRP